MEIDVVSRERALGKQHDISARARGFSKGSADDLEIFRQGPMKLQLRGGDAENLLCTLSQAFAHESDGVTTKRTGIEKLVKSLLLVAYYLSQEKESYRGERGSGNASQDERGPVPREGVRSGDHENGYDSQARNHQS